MNKTVPDFSAGIWILQI